MQFKLVRWRRFLATETKSKQYFDLIRKDWMLVYWNWQNLPISIYNTTERSAQGSWINLRDKSLACRCYRKTLSSRLWFSKIVLNFPFLTYCQSLIVEGKSSITRLMLLFYSRRTWIFLSNLDSGIFFSIFFFGASTSSWEQKI